MAQEATESTATAPHAASDSQTLSQHELQSNLSLLKSKPRYRTSISTESPMVILTPPRQQEVIREERRLSASVSRSAASDDDDGHLVPPTEPEPQDVVKQLIDERRPSALQSLSRTIKELFIAKKVKEDGVPALVCDGVYLGSIGAAKNCEWLLSHGVTHILCVAGDIGACFPSQFAYKVIAIDDAPDEDICAHFDASLAFIEAALSEGGKVLVHCFAGVSRSVTVVSAYLMHSERIGAVAALQRVRAKRAVANPNAGFIVQLIRFQRTLQLPLSEDEDEENEKEQSDDGDGDDAVDVSASSLVQKWESGRRPSMLTALAKLNALKKRSRAQSDATEASEVLKSGPSSLSLLKETSTGRSLDGDDVVTPLEEYDADAAFPATPPQKDEL